MVKGFDLLPMLSMGQNQGGRGYSFEAITLRGLISKIIFDVTATSKQRQGTVDRICVEARQFINSKNYFGKINSERSSPSSTKMTKSKPGPIDLKAGSHQFSKPGPIDLTRSWVPSIQSRVPSIQILRRWKA